MTAKHIDEEFDAFFIENKVSLARILFNVQAVLETRTATRDDPDSKAGSLRQTLPGHVTPMPPASSREMACSAFPTRTVSGPPNGSADRSFTFLPGTSASFAR